MCALYIKTLAAYTGNRRVSPRAHTQPHTHAHTHTRRFRYAVNLLRRGNDVLMHDADVFFRPGGLLTTLRLARAQQSSARPVDFLLQPNGRRRESYDDLNWGVAFISSTRRAASVLECMLDTWTHSAFRGHKRSWYHARSQPRINHILEAAIANAATPAAEPTVCTFPQGLFADWGRERDAVATPLGYEGAKAGTVVHFTAHGSTARKLQCAKAEALLSDTPSNAHRRIVFAPPRSATPTEQAQALAAAVHLAVAVDATVSLPPASLPSNGGDGAGRRVPLCRLLDIASLPLHITAATLPAATLLSICAREERGASDLARDGAAAGTTCVSFDSLLRRFASAVPPITALPRCDPWDQRVVNNHACTAALGVPDEKPRVARRRRLGSSAPQRQNSSRSRISQSLSRVWCWCL